MAINAGVLMNLNEIINCEKILIRKEVYYQKN
jgi:hypothetical protein